MSLLAYEDARDLFDLNDYIADTFFASEGAIAFTHLGASSQGEDWTYHQGVDKVITVGTFTDNGSPSSFSGEYIVAFDPRLDDLTQTQVVAAPTTLQPQGWFCGQLNVVTGEQRLYAYRALANNALAEYDPYSLTLITQTAWANPGGPTLIFNRDGPNNPETGPLSWGENSGDGAAAEAQHRFQVFEGLTDGVPGETILTGTDVYPQGLILAANVEHGVANGSAGDFDEAHVWIDIATGQCVGALRDVNGILIPGATDFGTAAGSEPRVFSTTVNWSKPQFIPDPDATVFSKPKGLLVLTSEFDASNETGGDPDLYVKAYDFNPFGLDSEAGVPERSHGRLRIHSRGVADYDMGSVTLSANQFQRQAFLIPSDQMIATYQGVSGATQPASGRFAMFSWRPQVEVAHVTPPTPVSSVQDADLVKFEVRATGDMGEPVEGALVSWSIAGRATINEVCDFAGGNPLTLSVTPLDRAGGFATMELRENGTPLVQSVDWRVNDRSTSEVELLKAVVGGAVYQMDYTHLRTNGATAYGTIVESDATTDVNGVATCTVQYANPEQISQGAFDRLTATVQNSYDARPATS